jgi:hypothetical protein
MYIFNFSLLQALLQYTIVIFRYYIYTFLHL